MILTRPGRAMVLRFPYRLLAGVCAAAWFLPSMLYAIDGEAIGGAAADMGLGYDANRFNDSSEQSSAFMTVTPRLQLTWFATEQAELNVSARYAHIEYLDDAFTYSRDTSADLSLLQLMGRMSIETRISAGSFEDHDAPEDDNNWIAFTPTVWGTAPSGIEYSLSGTLTRYSYEAAPEWGLDAYDSVYWQVRPGISLPLGRRVAVWTDVLIEGVSSDLPGDEYDSLGVAAGVTASHYRWKGGASVEWTPRDYTEDNVDGRTRKDESLWLDMWTSRRLRPWLDAFASVRWSTRDTSTPGYDYDDWSGQAGLRLTGERSL